MYFTSNLFSINFWIKFKNIVFKNNNTNYLKVNMFIIKWVHKVMDGFCINIYKSDDLRNMKYE